MKVRVTAIKHMGLRRLAIAASIVPILCVLIPLAIVSSTLRMLQTAWVAWSTRNPQPEVCECGVVGDAIIIRMPLDLLAHCASTAPFMHHIDPLTSDPADSFRVTDPKVFGESVKRMLISEKDESGLTLIHEMFDQAIEDAVDNGEEGFAWPANGIR